MNESEAVSLLRILCFMPTDKVKCWHVMIEVLAFFNICLSVMFFATRTILLNNA
jgi:hypothetical protein